MAGRRARRVARALGGGLGMVIALVILATATLLGPLVSGTRADPTVQSSPQGDWVGTYGANGYDLGANDGIGGDLSALSNAAVTLTRGARYVWDWCTSDPRALQSPDQTTRTAATYYGADQIIVTLPFASAYSGNLHLYAVDWDQLGRRETITVNDGNGDQQRAFQATSARALGSHSLSTSPPRARSLSRSPITAAATQSSPASSSAMPDQARLRPQEPRRGSATAR